MTSQLYDHIIADPNILAGKPIVEGTRVPASTLIEQVAAGKSLHEVARDHGVTAEDVRAALQYAARLAEKPATDRDSTAHPDDDDAPARTRTAAGDEEARRVGLDPAQLSPLGRRLVELRARGMATGEPPLATWEELDAEIRDRRGGTYPDADR